MPKDQRRLGKGRRGPTVALLLVLALFASACSVTASASSGLVSMPAVLAATAPASAGQNPNSRIDCTGTYKANLDLDLALLQLVSLTPASDYAALTDPTSPVYLDFAQLYADLNTLAVLPDPGDAAELTFGTPSESRAYVRQLIDVAERDIQAQGKPFQDTNSAGEKVLGMDSSWLKEISPLGRAINRACPGFILTADTRP